MDARSLVAAGDGANALQRFERACAEGDADACRAMRTLLADLPRDSEEHQRSVAVLDEACRGGSDAACSTYGSDLSAGTAAEQTRAREVLEGPCDRGEARACMVLAILLDNGDGGPRDAARAAQLNQRACEAGEGIACHNLAVALANAAPPAGDLARAFALFTRACANSIELSCDYARSVEQQLLAEPPEPAGPRFATTLDSASVDGVAFTDVRATCGAFEVLALLTTFAERMGRCEGRARIIIEEGSATGEALDDGGTCLVRAVRRGHFGALSCTIELSTARGT